MTPDYFDAKKTGGSKDSIEITIDVKAEKVMDFANEIRNATLDEVLEIINAEHDSVTNAMNIDKEYVSVYTVINDIRAAVEALRGEQDE